jgi:hypothetical protein
LFQRQIARCFYYFFMVVVVIRYKTKATARRALTFIVRIFVNDTIAIAVWTSFHVCVCVCTSKSMHSYSLIMASKTSIRNSSGGGGGKAFACR